MNDETNRSKLFIIAHIPPALERELLQHVRNFDTAHPGCHFEIGVDGPDRPLAEMVEMLRVDPGLTFTKIFDRESPKRTQTGFSEAGEAVRKMSNAIADVLAGKPFELQGAVIADVVATWVAGFIRIGGTEEQNKNARGAMLASLTAVIERLIPVNARLHDMPPPTSTKQ